MAKKSKTTETVAAVATLESEETAVSTGEELSFYQRYKLDKQKAETLLPIEDCANAIAQVDEVVALQYADLHNTIKPVDDEDEWRPVLVAVASKKGNEEAYDSAGNGGLYFHDTKIPVPEGTLFFPLYAHTEHTWWSEDNKALCKSIDGVTGNRFDGPEAPSILKCGSASCPNIPDRFQKSADPCKYTKSLYVIDSNFTNIYSLSLKYHSIKECLELMRKGTKKGGDKFSPVGASWFTLRTFEQGTEARKGWYLKAVPTDVEVTEAQAKALTQTKILTKLFHQEQVKNLDAKKSELGNDAMETVEVNAETVETGEESDSYAEM